MGLFDRSSSSTTNLEQVDNRTQAANATTGDAYNVAEGSSFSSVMNDNTQITYTDIGAVEGGLSVAQTGASVAGSVANTAVNAVSDSVQVVAGVVGDSVDALISGVNNLIAGNDAYISGANELSSDFISGANELSSDFISGANELSSDFISGANDLSSGIAGSAESLTSKFLNTLENLAGQVFSFATESRENAELLTAESFNLAGQSTIGAGYNTVTATNTTSKTLLYGAAILAAALVVTKVMK